MAAWLLPLAALMTVGGIGAQAMGARQADRARADALAAQRTRDRDYTRQTEEVVQGTADRYADPRAQMAERQASLADLYAAPRENPTAMLPAANNAVVQNAETAARDEARRFTDQIGRARADMRSFGDVLAAAGRGAQRDAGQLQTIDSFRRGDASVLPLELEAAQGRGGGMRMLGSLLQGAGQIGMAAGLTNPANLPSWMRGGAAAGPVTWSAGAP